MNCGDLLILLPTFAIVIASSVKNMNPWLLRIPWLIGIGAVVSAAALIYEVWKNQKNSTYTHINPRNYDGSNITSCCICLTEFKFLEKNEVISLPCGHKVCRECCKKMFAFQVRNRRNCPQCRQLIPEILVSQII